MPSEETSGSLSRRGLLLGAAAAATATSATRSAAAQVQASSRFDVQRFVEDCRVANRSGADGQAGVREVLTRAMSGPRAVLNGLGEPQKGGIQTLYRSTELTILNIVWSPLMQLMPHEHGMWALIGIYTGRDPSRRTTDIAMGFSGRS